MADPTSPQPPDDPQSESQLPYELPDIDLESDGLDEVAVPAGAAPANGASSPAPPPAQTTYTGPTSTPAPTSHLQSVEPDSFASTIQDPKPTGLAKGIHEAISDPFDRNPDCGDPSLEQFIGWLIARLGMAILAIAGLTLIIALAAWLFGDSPDSADAHATGPDAPTAEVREAMDRQDAQREARRRADDQWAESMGRRTQVLEDQQESRAPADPASAPEQSPASQPTTPFNALAQWVKKTRPDGPTTQADPPAPAASAGSAPAETVPPAAETSADPHADLSWHARTPGGFSLTCVMRGPRGTRAIINNEILGEGDTIKNAKVIAIRPGYVLLVLDGKKFRLDLE